jgi:hypothetical protein
MPGVDLKTVQEPMGHKTIAMTARYAHLAPTHKLRALETLIRSGSLSGSSGRKMATEANTRQKVAKRDRIQVIVNKQLEQR